MKPNDGRRHPHQRPAPVGYAKTTEAMERAGVSKMTIYRRTQDGSLNLYRFPGIRANLYKISELDALFGEPVRVPVSEEK